MLQNVWGLRGIREGNANAALNSYFGSNGTVPMAKEKDALAKLFEKYRGE